jgi:hypothetical protein
MQLVISIQPDLVRRGLEATIILQSDVVYAKKYVKDNAFEWLSLVRGLLVTVFVLLRNRAVASPC